jgi:glycosyltransferase involved in cell wall biosynthesis
MHPEIPVAPAVHEIAVLFAVRGDLTAWPGGDTVQIEGTAGALRNRGVHVTVTSSTRIDPAGFDCVHLWHLERVHENFVHLRRAVAAGVPVVLSPIYWPPGGRPRPGEGRLRSWREEVKNIVRLFTAGTGDERRAVSAAVRHGWAACRQEIVEQAAVLLPNSQAEAGILAEEFPGQRLIRVVPNAVDVTRCLAARSNGRRAGVLCVGHFDPRKNQHGLVEALRGTDIHVTFVGEGRRRHRAYYRRCRRRAAGRHRFLGVRPAETVRSLLGAARVHVCPSRFETPGLVNLEAAVLGCAIVVPDCPPVREYFGAAAHYFRPHDRESLRQAVTAALASAPDPELAARLAARCTWEHAAARTHEAYRHAVQLRYC